MVGAKHLGMHDEHTQLKGILMKHIARGYLTPDLAVKRHDLANKVFARAKATMSPGDYNKFHGAF
jgi:hypothetical protein